MRHYCKLHKRMESTYYFISWTEHCELCEHDTTMYQVIKATSYRAMKRLPEVTNISIMAIYDA